jgi:hypothetical protein
MKLIQATSILLAILGTTPTNINSSEAAGIHQIIQKERRHIVFNSRQLSGECRK